MLERKQGINYEKFKAKAKQARISLREFANYIGVHPVTISKWREKGTVPFWAQRVLESYIAEKRAKKAKEKLYSALEILEDE